MRGLALAVAGPLLASACSVHRHRIPPDELARLARIAPDARGQRVRVVQDIVASDVPAAPPVTRETQVVIVPEVDVSVGVHGSHRFGSSFRGGKITGLGSDS